MNGVNIPTNRHPTIEDISTARTSLDMSIRKTPLHKSDMFSRMVGTDIFLKLECLQKTGSFKVRGAFTKLNSLSDKERSNGVIAASAGNHAQGLAYASSKENIRCTIVMPRNASPAKVAATRSYGARVILSGENYEASWDETVRIAKEQRLAIVHAFNDNQVVCGQGTIGLELLEDLNDFDRIYLPIGGGGLAAGVAIAVKAKRPNVKIIGVESEAFPSMKESIAKGKLQTINSGYTIADGISVKSPGELTYEIVTNLVDDIVLVDDTSIVKTMFLLMERAKLVVEPAGGS